MRSRVAPTYKLYIHRIGSILAAYCVICPTLYQTLQNFILSIKSVDSTQQKGDIYRHEAIYDVFEILPVFIHASVPILTDDHRVPYIARYA